MKRDDSLPRKLRRFGFTVATGLAILGFVGWYRSHTYVPAVLWTLAATLLLLAVANPRLLAPVEKVWMSFAAVLGWINTRIILALLFYLVFAPMGLIMRLFRDPLDRKIHDGRKSYWLKKESREFDPQSYQNQF